MEFKNISEEEINKEYEKFKIRYNAYKNAKTAEEKEKNQIYTKDFDLLLKKIEILENENKKKTLILNKRKISNEQVEEIKRLRAEGLSYAKIEERTNWSKFTISGVLNGKYDK